MITPLNSYLTPDQEKVLLEMSGPRRRCFPKPGTIQRLKDLHLIQGLSDSENRQPKLTATGYLVVRLLREARK